MKSTSPQPDSPVHEGAAPPVLEGAAPLIRAARESDVPFLASVLAMAGRGHLERGPWDLLFPDTAERQRALEYMAAGPVTSWCHREYFHVAELQGQPCAALVAFDAARLGDTSLAAPLYATFAMLGWSEERAAGLGPLLGPYVACFPDMPPDTWIVENVGTRKDARRHGLVRALLDRALEAGRRSGCSQAQISCLIGNDAAQRAYERAGFEVVEEKRDPAFEALIGAPGFSRMTRTLDTRAEQQ